MDDQLADYQPSCAICGCRPTPELPGRCSHEAEALTKSLQQAIDRRGRSEPSDSMKYNSASSCEAKA